MATAHLYRTQGTATDRKKFTVSMWVKFAKTGSDLTAFQFMDFYNSGTDRLSLYHDNADKLNLYHEKAGGGSSSVTFVSDMVLRDKGAWYHLVWRFDSTQATSTDRIKVYVNGEQITFGTYTFSEAQNYEFAQGTSSYTQYLGTYGGNLTTNNFDGVMSHVHFCDGYSYGADSFGSTDSTTGEWKINTSPSVTYGNNGFFVLKDNSSGTDQSGNTNNLTASGTLTNTEDCPSNVFCVNNDLTAPAGGVTLAHGNTSVTGNASDSWRDVYGTLGASSGKFYWEQKINNFTGSNPHYIGICDSDLIRQASGSNCFEQSSISRAYAYTKTGQKLSANTLSSYGDSWTTGDIVGVAVDLDNGKIYFSKNGTWQNSGDPTSGSTGTGSAFDVTTGYIYLPCTSTYYSLNQYSYNFGNGYFGTTAITSEGTNASNIGKFEYDVPTGYTALSTNGLNE